MIDLDKLDNEERKAMAIRCKLIGQYFDEAHLIVNEISAPPQHLPFVALMLLILRH